MPASMKIRAHHLLCMQGFQGYGYSNDFTNHLQNIVTQLRTNPNTLIQVVAECDTICDGCPNLNESKCQKDNADSDSLIKNIDFNVLKHVGIDADSIMEFSLVIEKINEVLKNRAQLVDICGDCQWIEKCTWYLALNSPQIYP